jgi:DNA polymerase-3 subunit delta'
MSFKNIKGQDKTINILKSYIAQSRLSGGYLFVGPEGVGKKLVAKTLAKALNCLEKNTDTSTSLSVNGDERVRTIDSCDRCASCQKIDNNLHPDIHVIDCTDTEVKIEYIRQLQRDISLKAYEGKVKVFIINNAHTLTSEASNALLKILEEPPKNSLIILITDKPNLLFKTIISRCKVLKFFPLVRKELKEIIQKDYGLDNSTAHFLAYFSEGRLGCALRLKELDILREKNRIINTFALSPKKTYDNLDIQSKDQIQRCLNILASWFRDIYLIKIGAPSQELINFDRKEELLKDMSRFSFLDLNDILDTISDSIMYLGQNINTRLLLNNLGAKLCKDRFV